MIGKAFRFEFWSVVIGGLCVFALLPITQQASASPRPKAVIETGMERVLGFLRTKCSDGQSVAMRYHRVEIEKIVSEYFDFREMAMRSLGPSWKQQAPDKQQEFTQLFKDLIFNTYIDRIDTYTCSNEKVTYDDEALDGNHAVVRTRITGYKGNKDIPLEYRLSLKDNDWKAYDVVIEGVSLVNNYRQQFASILNRESFEGLLKRMRDKNTEFK
ncbi:MAG TPA: organic solvent tolerance ABC transporter substrate-binding protein [Syntrophobacteraceae bacterium]|jgi:phospholipid transport system substrate-binding protein|nr:organic solvent tolerance ABC transporter substrate-binding protein [Syntrophobacteraceae bacterium]